MEQYEYRHDLTVGHAAGTVAMTLAWHLNSMFFQLWGKKFAEFVENTENFY
jgi:hypothetical protein